MFEDLKVIDCSTVLAGPSVGTFFAELGAQVTKYEHPLNPDVTRSWKLSTEDPSGPISAYFSSVNYLKSYAQINLNEAAQLDYLLTQLSHADIFISNFKRGDAEKFGLEDQKLLDLNPRLIIGKISGFGNESDRVAYDLILQAETGYMSMNGTAESGPVKMPVALIDVLAAHQLKEALLCALINRNKTGKGCVVSVSLYDAAICSLANQASNFLMEQHIPQRIGSLHPNIAPYGELFETADNKTVTFAIGSQRHFEGLCTYLNAPEIPLNPKFSNNVERVKNRTELYTLLQKHIYKMNSKELDLAMQERFIPFGIVRDLREVFANDQALRLVRSETIENKLSKRVTQIAFDINGKY